MIMAKRVLVIEDEPNIVVSLSFLLDRAGFEVSVESDGQVGLSSAMANPPDVVVLDVMLPGLSGYDVLRQLRADSRTKELPVIILTAKGQQEDRLTATECGADLFITKPFANTDIVDAVKRLAGRRQG
jgi:DNA-binding response OmpR family regulator